jgi:hypothetical protein
VQWVPQVQEEVQDQAFQAVRDNISRADVAHAQDYYGISNKGYAKLFSLVKKTMKDCGFKSTATPVPSPDEVNGIKRLISRKVLTWGIEYWPEGTGHAGYHVSTPEPTLRLIARLNELVSTYNSKTGDTLCISMGFDGAAMAELAHGKNLGFSNFECFNPLIAGKAPKGVKADSNQFLVGCAELDKKTGESHAVLTSMFHGWLVPSVNKWEEGMLKLRQILREKKKEVEAAEKRAALMAKAIAAAKKTMAAAEGEAAKAGEGTRQKADAETLIAEKVLYCSAADCQHHHRSDTPMLLGAGHTDCGAHGGCRGHCWRAVKPQD